MSLSLCHCRWRCRCLRLYLWPVLLCLWSAAATPALAAPARMLVFAEAIGVAPWYAQFLESLRMAVRAHHPDLELDVETFSVEGSFGGSSAGDREVPDWLLKKYAGLHYDIVLAGNPDQVGAVVQLRDRLWPRATVLMPTANEARQALVAGVPRLAGLQASDTAEVTLNLVFTLLPETRHVAVIANTLDSDPLRPNWRRSLRVLDGRARLIDLTGMPLPALRERVRSLPARTVVFFAAPGQTISRVTTPPDVVRELAATANAPLFVDVSTLLGQGAVGGAVMSPTALARAVARQVDQVLAGVPAERLGFEASPAPNPVFDWRALQRWHIAPDRLPEGSTVIERPPGLWEAYRVQVLAGLAVLVVQAGLIAALLLERRRRRVAEVQAREHLGTLARLNRGAALGALSAALAHEINQPLAAILSNAETAELLLDRPGAAPHTALRELLAEIREDDLRAAAVLVRLRAWIANVPGELQPVALNPLIVEVARLLQTEARLRETDLQLVLAPSLPAVVGDGVQVQQVVLNLVINALEALQAVPVRQRRISVTTALHGPAHVEVSVQDSGPGLRGLSPERLFEPFFSTKPQGLGVGLAISRSIVERHCGRLRVHEPGEGVCFSFTLPVQAALAEGA